jgi:hypothetical protein
MSAIHEGGFDMGPGLREQLSKGSLHKFEATSREQFEELMKVMSHLQEETKRENKLKEELRNLKGPKKSLVWKKS